MYRTSVIIADVDQTIAEHDEGEVEEVGQDQGQQQLMEDGHQFALDQRGHGVEIDQYADHAEKEANDAIQPKRDRL